MASNPSKGDMHSKQTEGRHIGVQCPQKDINIFLLYKHIKEPPGPIKVTDKSLAHWQRRSKTL